MRSVLLAALVAVSVGPTLSAADLSSVVEQYVDHCAPCHSMGGGEGVGPDLLNATKKTPQDLRVAVKAMEANVGPLTSEQIEQYVALLKAPDVQRLVGGGAAAPVVEKPPAAPPGSPDAGRHLFYGQKRLSNGGSPCFACHAVGGRGGNLAADLTGVHARLGDRVQSVTEKPPFPLMKNAYARHPVTPAEATDLAAFLRTMPAPAVASSLTETGVLHNAAAGAVVAVLGAVALLFRARREGVRSRMVRRSAGVKS